MKTIVCLKRCYKIRLPSGFSSPQIYRCIPRWCSVVHQLFNIVCSIASSASKNWTEIPTIFVYRSVQYRSASNRNTEIKIHEAKPLIGPTASVNSRRNRFGSWCPQGAAKRAATLVITSVIHRRVLERTWRFGWLNWKSAWNIVQFYSTFIPINWVFQMGQVMVYSYFEITLCESMGSFWMGLTVQSSTVVCSYTLFYQGPLGCFIKEVEGHFFIFWANSVALSQGTPTSISAGALQAAQRPQWSFVRPDLIFCFTKRVNAWIFALEKNDYSLVVLRCLRNLKWVFFLHIFTMKT